jgi:hypothetical protein
MAEDFKKMEPGSEGNTKLPKTWVVNVCALDKLGIVGRKKVILPSQIANDPY